MNATQKMPEIHEIKEWLVTNGLGGYASGTVTGEITRRYHGLLIAALPNPLGRLMLLNGLSERLRLPDRQSLLHWRGGSVRRGPRRDAAALRIPPRSRPPGVALRNRGLRCSKSAC